MGCLSASAVTALSDRLAAEPDLRLPGNLTRGKQEVDQQQRKQYLVNLLERDAGVFLERYGERLSAAELEQFSGLREDYEVDFYLRYLEASSATPSLPSATPSTPSATHKNRRLAYMNRLLLQGEYFSDSTMRARQPLLHHQYVGLFRPMQAPSMSGAKLSDSILAGYDEAEIQAQLEREWDREKQQYSEEEGSDEEAEVGAASQGEGWQSGAAATAPVQSIGAHDAASAPQPANEDETEHIATSEASEEECSFVQIPDAERQELQDDFLELMKNRFLSGADAEVDYQAIDADASLDEDWSKQQQQDAEDQYFANE